MSHAKFTTLHAIIVCPGNIGLFLNSGSQPLEQISEVKVNDVMDFLCSFMS